MKLNVEIRKRKDVRGRILGYTARLGNWDADGATQREAEANLTALIERMAHEDAEPLVRIDPQDGSVWMAYRLTHGEWGYGHYRLPGAEFYANGRTAPIGYTYGAGWTVPGGEAAKDKKAVVEMMDRHLVSLMPSGKAA